MGCVSTSQKPEKKIIKQQQVTERMDCPPAIDKNALDVKGDLTLPPLANISKIVGQEQTTTINIENEWQTFNNIIQQANINQGTMVNNQNLVVGNQFQPQNQQMDPYQQQYQQNYQQNQQQTGFAQQAQAQSKNYLSLVPGPVNESQQQQNQQNQAMQQANSSQGDFKNTNNPY